MNIGGSLKTTLLIIAMFLNGAESLFIEAKSLEKDLHDRKWISQNLSYAVVVGVQWCTLTNGDEYRIYNSHAAVGLFAVTGNP